MQKQTQYALFQLTISPPDVKGAISSIDSSRVSGPKLLGISLIPKAPSERRPSATARRTENLQGNRQT